MERIKQLAFPVSVCLVYLAVGVFIGLLTYLSFAGEKETNSQAGLPIIFLLLDLLWLAGGFAVLYVLIEDRQRVQSEQVNSIKSSI